MKSYNLTDFNKVGYKAATGQSYKQPNCKDQRFFVYL